MRDLVTLVRAGNLLLAGAGVLAGGWIAVGAVVTPPALWWATVSGMALGAVGNVLNDLWDRPADRVNRPDRPLAAGTLAPRTARLVAAVGAVVGLGAALAVGPWQVLMAASALAVMAAYSPVLKPRGLPGNLAVAVVASLPLPYGALAVGHIAAGWLPFAIAAWIHLTREIMKDIADVDGDRRAGRRTLPIVLGPEVSRRAVWALAALFVPLSVAPVLAGYGWAYLLLAIPADAVLAAAAVRLQRPDGASPAARLSKVAMGLGLAGLVLGRAL
jgi:geranylgeranylglycerol-phosphate geranylgeranyltransferase